MEEFIHWLMREGSWQHSTWFVYVTFHDLFQWGIIGLFGLTAWGERRKKKQLEKLIEHIHEELHTHIEEDSSLHRVLGQTEMTKGV